MNDNALPVNLEERVRALEFMTARTIDLLFTYVDSIRNAYEHGPITQEGRDAVDELIGMRIKLDVSAMAPPETTPGWASNFSTSPLRP